MSAQHTPGLWIVRGDPGYTYVAGGNPTFPICDVAMSRPASGDDWHRANACLISAAPDLLAALRSAENWLSEYETGPDSGVTELLAQIRAAIAKAEGSK